MFSILEIMADGEKAHKYNLIGKPFQPGDLERHLNRKFDDSDRVMAWRAFEQLVKDRLVEPTLSDMAAPDDWVRITNALGHHRLSPHHGRWREPTCVTCNVSRGTLISGRRKGMWSRALMPRSV